MYINHIAILVKDLEGMKKFYEEYFNTTSSELYYNQKTQFKSYFLTFQSGARLELTNKKFNVGNSTDSLGYTHIAITVGDKKAVDLLAKKLMEVNYPLLNGPRTTGDGYYEAVIQDPEGNLIELTTN